MRQQQGNWSPGLEEDTCWPTKSVVMSRLSNRRRQGDTSQFQSEVMSWMKTDNGSEKHNGVQCPTHEKEPNPANLQMCISAVMGRTCASTSNRRANGPKAEYGTNSVI